MNFGMEGAPQMHWSKENLKKATEKLETMENPPVFGEGGDTGERGDKYFAMGYEVEKPEYDLFMEEFHKIMEMYDESDLDKSA